MKYIFIMIFGLSTLAQAADLMTCELKGGGSIRIISELGSRKATLSLSKKAERRFANFGAQELRDAEVPFLVETSNAEKSYSDTKALEAGGSVNGEFKCGLTLVFEPSKKQLKGDSRLPLDSKATNRLTCNISKTEGVTAQIKRCYAGGDLKSLNNLQNFAESEVED